ncbi:MAG TPA: cobalamin-dependent protein [Patescibacteria group bacterium]|nr:cobalamin-dependent protein [Patescibacteria group bacterium]
MAEIVLWNSVAARRRSISDTFYDNGLATIKGHLEDKGHQVEIIDWARDDFFESLSPAWLTGLIRKIYSRMMKTKNGAGRKVLGLISMQLQAYLDSIQQRRLRAKLKQLAIELRNRRVNILGIKIWYGHAFTNAKLLVKLVKEVAPGILTVAGGYHVTLYEEHVLEASDFDLAVACEGEFALAQILNVVQIHSKYWAKHRALQDIVKLAEQGKIENLIYRKYGKICKTPRRQVSVHSSKSIPRYLINENKVSIHVMVESLGCDWGKCHFCVHSQFYSNYALRDPEEICAEIEAMRLLGIGVFRFAGSDTPPAFGAKIAAKIKEKGLKVVFGMGSRPIRGAAGQFENLVGAYTTLIESGLRAMFMGGETGNDVINEQVMNKGVAAADIVATIAALREAEKRTGEKVYLSLALIYPTPLLGLTTLEQVKQDNIRLLKEARPDSVMITPPGPFLHTKWYEDRGKFGFTVDEGIIEQGMEYEYVLYKPPELWPRLGIALEGRPFKVLLAECNEMRKIVENELGIPTDISDEHFLMFYSAGIRDRDGVARAKKETMLDIVSCDYRLTREISAKVNAFSRWLTTT